MAWGAGAASGELAPLAGHGEHVHTLEDNQQVSSTVSRTVLSPGYRISTYGTVAEAFVAEAFFAAGG